MWTYRLSALKPATILVLVPLLSACISQVPPLNFSVPNVGFSEQKIDAELRSVTVTIGRPDEQVGAMDMILAESAGTQVSTGAALTGMWKEALLESLNRMVIFKDRAERRFSLSVKILEVDMPSFGFDMIVPTTALYEIIDRANGDIVFTTKISTTGATTVKEQFVGVTRARESLNRSVQNNIATFLQQLQTVDISKPMFPVPVANRK